MNADRLIALYDKVAELPDATDRLRRFVLDLGVRGKLVKQNLEDEPASDLLNRIVTKAKGLPEIQQLRKKATSIRASAAVPFELPETWKWARIGEIFLYDAGLKRAPDTLDPSLWLLELKDIEKDTGCLLARVRAGSRNPKSTKSEFRKGDILYGKLRPYLSKVLVADSDGYSTTEITAIRPLVPVSLEYCALALRRPDFVAYVTHVGQGTKMPRLRIKDALNAFFPLPPVAEQHRIVAKVAELMSLCDRLEESLRVREETRDMLATASFGRLDHPDPDVAVFRSNARFAIGALPVLTARADQIRQLRETILNLAVRGKLVEQDSEEEQAQTQLQSIQTKKKELARQAGVGPQKPVGPISGEVIPFDIPFSWEWSRLGEIAMFTQYGTSSKASPSDAGVPVLTMGNIKDGAVVCKSEKRLPKTSKEFPSLFLKKYDLLYNRTNSAQLVGKTGIYLGSDDCMTFASYLIRIRLSESDTSPKFVNLVMNSPIFRETQIVPNIKKQTGQANVSGSVLRNMLLPLPPLSEQQRIVAKVDELMILCDAIEASLRASDIARQRLLNSFIKQALEEGGLPETAQV